VVAVLALHTQHDAQIKAHVHAAALLWQDSKHASKQASKQASQQARKQANKQASKQAGKQASKQIETLRPMCTWQAVHFVCGPP
jgi:hypothetical protein